jgi:hypothetical protein
VFRRFGHLEVLFIEKYQYGENRVANSIFEKSFNTFKKAIYRIGLKMPRTFLRRILKFAFLGAKIPRVGNPDVNK